MNTISSRARSHSLQVLKTPTPYEMHEGLVKFNTIKNTSSTLLQRTVRTESARHADRTELSQEKIEKNQAGIKGQHNTGTIEAHVGKLYPPNGGCDAQANLTKLSPDATETIKLSKNELHSPDVSVRGAEQLKAMCADNLQDVSGSVDSHNTLPSLGGNSIMTSDSLQREFRSEGLILLKEFGGKGGELIINYLNNNLNSLPRTQRILDKMTLLLGAIGDEQRGAFKKLAPEFINSLNKLASYERNAKDAYQQYRAQEACERLCEIIANTATRDMCRSHPGGRVGIVQAVINLRIMPDLHRLASQYGESANDNYIFRDTIDNLKNQLKMLTHSNNVGDFHNLYLSIHQSCKANDLIKNYFSKAHDDSAMRYEDGLNPIKDEGAGKQVIINNNNANNNQPNLSPKPINLNFYLGKEIASNDKAEENTTSDSEAKIVRLESVRVSDAFLGNILDPTAVVHIDELVNSNGLSFTKDTMTGPQPPSIASIPDPESMSSKFECISSSKKERMEAHPNIIN